MKPAYRQIAVAGGDDTIAVIATASGRGAGAGERAARVCRGGGAWQPAQPQARMAVRCVLRDAASQKVIDDALVTRFEGRASFTGEDVVEFSTHGGRVVRMAVLAACLRAGVRQAAPEAFTWRALLNGKIDLLQAQANQGLVDARTSI